MLNPVGFFYGPWPNDNRLFTRQVIERHMGRCRALGIREQSNPTELAATMASVTPEARQAAIDAGEDAMRMSDAMFADSPPGSTPYGLTDNPYAPLYDPPGSWDHLCLWGGRSAAKSFHVAEYLAEQASRETESVLCLRQFQNSVAASAKALIQDRIVANNMAAFFTFTENAITNTSTGSTFQFWGVERQSESLKSATGITVAWVEEAQTASANGIELITPTVRDQGSRLIWTGNTRHVTDPWHDMFINPETDRPENAVVRCVNAECNAHHYRTRSPAEMRTSFKAAQRIGDLSKYRHIWRGFINASASTLVVRDMQSGIPPVDIAQLSAVVPLYGCDFGFSDDPSTGVRVWRFTPDQLLDWDGPPVLYIDREFCNLNLSTQGIVDAFDANMPCLRENGFSVTADSAEPRTIAEMNAIADGAFTVEGAVKGPGSVNAGYRFWNGHATFVHPDCVDTLKALQNMRYKTDRAGKATTEIEHTWTHIPDGVRYAVEALALAENPGVVWV